MQTFGVIFDMDGVLMDNNLYHEIAWKRFCERYDVQLTDEELHEFVFGRVAKDTLEFIFRRELTPEEIEFFVEEKELIYRKLYQPLIKPLDGLMDFLDDLEKNRIPMAMATSAPAGNIEFAFRHIPVAKYFRFYLDASNVKKGKPDPEIYLRSIEKLGLPPRNCFIFEDSHSGIKAAIGSGARVIGVSSTHEPAELNGVEKVIPDFTGIKFEDLRSIIDKNED
jgi:HAD superfamily hydrolase (TIGR01509 family)